MLRRGSFLVLVALLPLITLLAACNQPPTSGPTENYFNGVVALSATNAWAVGGMSASDGRHVLIEHWDGSKWQANSPSAHGILCGIAAISANDMWAVGEDTYLGDCAGVAGHDTLTLHWDGKRWSRVPSPAPGTDSNYLSSVAAVSSRDAWAVGATRNEGGSSLRPLIIHWDGKNWSPVPQPAPFTFLAARMTSVKALSSTDVWAVGEYVGIQGGGERTLAEHWDGKSWRLIPTPDHTQDQRILASATFHGLTALATKNLLAVGQADLVGRVNNSSYELSGALVERWDGSRWNIVYTPTSANRGPANLQDVETLTARDVWAVGESSINTGQALMMLHWDGRNWRVVDLPAPEGAWSYLNAMAAVAANNIWVVGWASPSSYDPAKTLVEHWDGTSWRIIPSPNPGTPGPLVGTG